MAAILEKSKYCYISAKVQAILTKFGLKTQFDRWPFRPLKFEILKIQDGGGRHLENSKNSHISFAVWPILTKFVSTVPTVKNLKFPKSKAAAAAILKNRENAISQLRAAV